MLIAFVRSSTPSSMVVVVLSWALTLALSDKRETAKASCFPSSCLLVMRRGLSVGSDVRSTWRVAVNEICCGQRIDG